MMKPLNPRRVGLVCAACAVLTGAVLAGCGDRVQGTALPDTVQVSIYKTEAASSSAAATSSRRAAAQAQAIGENCGAFPNTTGAGVRAYNEFVDAHDANAPDYAAKRDAAAQTLDGAAGTVEAGVNAAGESLPPDLAAKFIEYVSAARQLAEETRKMSYHANVDALNAASLRVNDARNAVREACPAR
ncbi:hypothetical protein [Nocardia farcinica]|nr:hypothetical protein [Nocardia farcinica]